MTAPITPSEFWKFPGLPKNTEMADADVQSLLDKAWTTMETWCNQPLTLTTSSETILHNSMYCNSFNGVMTILPKYFPIKSLVSIQCVSNNQNYYVNNNNVVIQDRKISVYDSPFSTGQTGVITISYTHGFNPIPDDLITALCLTTNHFLSAGYFPTSGGVAEGSLTPAWLPKDVEMTLARYRRSR